MGCPTFVYGEIDGEVPTVMHEQTHKLIPGSELVLWKAHGHVSIAMESGGIFAALVQGKSFPGDYGAMECSVKKPLKGQKWRASMECGRSGAQEKPNAQARPGNTQ